MNWWQYLKVLSTFQKICGKENIQQIQFILYACITIFRNFVSVSEEEKKPLIDFTIRHAWHRISRMYNQKAQIHGLTMSYGFILMMVKKEGTPSTKLGPMMGMEPTSLSRTLKLMEDEGFIKRGESATDKRKVLIFLTDKGLEKRLLIRSFLLNFNDELAARTSSDDLKGFHNVMNALEGLMEDLEKEQK